MQCSNVSNSVNNGCQTIRFTGKADARSALCCGDVRVRESVQHQAFSGVPAGGCLRTVTSGKVSVCAGPFTADTPRGRELPKDSRPVGWYLSDDVALDIHQDINVAVRTVEDADGAVRLWQ